MLAKQAQTYSVKTFPELQLNNIDLAQLKHVDAQSLQHMLDLYNQYHVLIIRKQILNEEQLIQISKLFGEPAPALVPTFRLKDYPVITRHTNVKNSDQSAKGVVAPQYVFHADSYFAPNPTKTTLFYCLKAPNVGGETLFVDMCAVYDSLDTATQKLIENKRVLYKNAFINRPPASHPMVRKHPVTGKKALFVNKHRALGIEDFPENEALPLIHRLYDYAVSPQFVYQHKWQANDLLIWNNVTTMHAATPIPDSEERLLHRILTQGDLPVA